ncbi:hypothetical protein EfmAA242_25770 [Enterococcus faecium]|nr:hypothetical protein EfmAA242_25770 [Enterococcus faecium]
MKFSKLTKFLDSPTYVAKSKAGNLYTVTSVDGLGGAGAYDKDFHFLKHDQDDSNIW